MAALGHQRGLFWNIALIDVNIIWTQDPDPLLQIQKKYDLRNMNRNGLSGITCCFLDVVYYEKNYIDVVGVYISLRL